MRQLKGLPHAFVLLDPPPSLSRLHASRRVFSTFKDRQVELPIIHHIIAPNCAPSELALQLGIQAGSLLGDGLGDGVLIETVSVRALPHLPPPSLPHPCPLAPPTTPRA